MKHIKYKMVNFDDLCNILGSYIVHYYVNNIYIRAKSRIETGISDNMLSAYGTERYNIQQILMSKSIRPELKNKFLADLIEDLIKYSGKYTNGMGTRTLIDVFIGYCLPANKDNVQMAHKNEIFKNILGSSVADIGAFKEVSAFMEERYKGNNSKETIVFLQNMAARTVKSKAVHFSEVISNNSRDITEVQQKKELEMNREISALTAENRSLKDTIEELKSKLETITAELEKVKTENAPIDIVPRQELPFINEENNEEDVSIDNIVEEKEENNYQVQRQRHISSDDDFN
jgi:hypothetical protein